MKMDIHIKTKRIIMQVITFLSSQELLSIFLLFCSGLQLSPLLVLSRLNRQQLSAENL